MTGEAQHSSHQPRHPQHLMHGADTGRAGPPAWEPCRMAIDGRELERGAHADARCRAGEPMNGVPRSRPSRCHARRTTPSQIRTNLSDTCFVPNRLLFPASNGSRRQRDGSSGAGAVRLRCPHGARTHFPTQNYGAEQS